jgi:hypothetical protein
MARAISTLVVLAAFALPAAASAGPWTGTQRLTVHGPSTFDLAGNEHGRRAIAWADGHGVFVAIAPRGGRFGGARRIVGTPANPGPRLAMDGRGDIAVVWTHDTSETLGTGIFGDDGCCRRLMGALLRRDGRLSKPVRLGVGDRLTRFQPQLSSDTRGHLALAYVQGPVYARFGDMRTGFGKARLMSRAGDFGIPVTAGHGRVIYATTGSSGAHTVETSRTAKGTLVRRVLLDLAIEPNQIGSDDRGRQIAVWGAGVFGTRTPPGPFHYLPGAEQSGGPPAVGVTGSGAAVAMWQRYIPASSDTRSDAELRLYASVRRPGSRFAQPMELDRFDDGGQIAVSSADAGPDGSSVVGVLAGWPRVYLLPRSGGLAERLVATRDPEPQDLRVLRDARGTLAVVASRNGLVASWVR